MAIFEDGAEGEKLGRKILKELFPLKNLMQLDWVFKSDDVWYSVEVKHKKMLTSSCDNKEYQGLDVYQIDRRLELQKECSIIAIILVVDKTTKDVYIQRLDKLEELGLSFDYRHKQTKSMVRMYPLEHFKCVGNIKDYE